jgi:hypothetical protein
LSKASPRNGNLEVPVYFSEVKQGYTVRKMGKRQTDASIFVSAGIKLGKKEVPVWYTGMYRPISSTDINL